MFRHKCFRSSTAWICEAIYGECVQRWSTAVWPTNLCLRRVCVLLKGLARKASPSSSSQCPKTKSPQPLRVVQLSKLAWPCVESGSGLGDVPHVLRLLSSGPAASPPKPMVYPSPRKCRSTPFQRANEQAARQWRRPMPDLKCDGSQAELRSRALWLIPAMLLQWAAGVNRRLCLWSQSPRPSQRRPYNNMYVHIRASCRSAFKVVQALAGKSV